MTYTVTWKPEVERELTAIWNESTDQQAIADAADLLDRELRKHAHSVGESRPDDVRIAFERPLGIRFRVLQQDRQVSVIAVWRTDRRTRA